MVTFDQALPALVRICEGMPGFVLLKTACVVRDLRGRLRLLIHPDPMLPPAQPSVDVIALQQQILQDLGDYFAPPIWSTAKGAQRDEARLASALIGQASEWPEADFDDPVSGTRITSKTH